MMQRFVHGLMLATVCCFLAGCPQVPGGGLYGGNGGDNDDDGSPVGDGMPRNFLSTLSGDQEVPPVGTGASGSGSFALNAEHTQLTYSLTVSGLSGPVVAAHFHSGAAGVNGDVAFAITQTVSENVDGTVTVDGIWTLDAADESALLAGNIYVNFHTGDHPGGEVRGQLELVE